MGIQEARLYYNDSYRWEFDSEVCSTKENDGYWVLLANSAFYPTSGGQPYDTGWLNDVRVTNVEADETGVWHQVEQFIPAHTKVKGRIDGNRRFDFMQQHSGQHVLSACFEQLLEVDTVSFHMGDSFSTIDLSVPEVSESDLERIELAANEWIWRDVPIRARFVTPEELAALNLRRPPKVEKDIRIVTIEGLEHNPCGGTHPSSTGQIGQILITKTERMRGGVRVQFACGNRALKYSRELIGAVRTLGNQLSVGIADIPPTVAGLQAQIKETRKELVELKQQLAGFQAKDALARTGFENGIYTLFLSLGDGYGAQELKPIVGAVTEGLASAQQVPYVVAVAGTVDEREYALVVASAESSVKANILLGEAFAKIGGKGGGNATSAQGSAPKQGDEPRLGRALEQAFKSLVADAIKE